MRDHVAEIVVEYGGLHGGACSALSESPHEIELIFAFAKQQSFKGGNLRVWWFKVGSILVEPFAQLCIHRTVFWFIESFFKDLEI